MDREKVKDQANLPVDGPPEEEKQPSRLGIISFIASRIVLSLTFVGTMVYFIVLPSHWLDSTILSWFDPQPLVAEDAAFEKALAMLGTPKEHKGFDQKNWCVCQVSKLPDGSFQIGLGDAGCKTNSQQLTIYPDHQYRSCWQQLTVGECGVKLNTPMISSDRYYSYTRDVKHLRDPGSYLTPCEGKEPDSSQLTLNGAMLDVPELLDEQPESESAIELEPDPLPILLAQSQE